jgi:peptidoglycan/LPS O-acetylase OafA/YrhL
VEGKRTPSLRRVWVDIFFVISGLIMSLVLLRTKQGDRNAAGSVARFRGS